MPCENEVGAAGSRLTNFKNRGKNTEEMRRRRNEVTIELRKQRKDDQLSKRRNISEADPTSPLQESNSQTTAALMSVEEIMVGMFGNTDEVRLKSVIAARKTLSREKSPPIDVMITAGIVPKCVEFLSYGHK